MIQLLIRALWGLCLIAPLYGAVSEELIPPVPAHYVEDPSGQLSSATRGALEEELAQFEQATSNQLIVAIYPKMRSELPIEDYTVRVAQKWGIGQKDRKNGVVLFVFSEDHKLYIQVGYGLEAVLPDLLASRIIQEQIIPSFKSGQFDQGIRNGVAGILAATKGEYKGLPKKSRKHSDSSTQSILWIVLLLLFIPLFVIRNYLPQNRIYGSGYSGSFGSSGGYGGGSFGGNGSSGGGGFSSGGGSFGGGGAGGSW